MSPMLPIPRCKREENKDQSRCLKKIKLKGGGNNFFLDETRICKIEERSSMLTAMTGHAKVENLIGHVMRQHRQLKAEKVRMEMIDESII